jgi:hypothetical protein
LRGWVNSAKGARVEYARLESTLRGLREGEASRIELAVGARKEDRFVYAACRRCVGFGIDAGSVLSASANAVSKPCDRASGNAQIEFLLTVRTVLGAATAIDRGFEPAEVTAEGRME